MYSLTLLLIPVLQLVLWPVSAEPSRTDYPGPQIPFSDFDADPPIPCVVPQDVDSSEPLTSRQKHVVVIGSGIAGSLATYNVWNASWAVGANPQITLFEASPSLGGRILASSLHNERGVKLDIGARTFTERDWCVKNALSFVGLRKWLAYDPFVDSLQAYAGHELVDVHDVLFNKWASLWDRTKFIFKYGRAPFTFKSRAEDVARRFGDFSTQLGGWDHVRSLKYVRLYAEATTKAWDYLDALLGPSGSAYLAEVLRPRLEAKLGASLLEVNALTALLAALPDPVYSSEHTNKQLINRLARFSEANVRLNTTVTALELVRWAGARGWEDGWRVKYRTTSGNGTHSHFAKDKTLLADAVVLASPFALNNISLSAPGLNRPSHPYALRARARARYIKRHITHIVTPTYPSPEALNITRGTMPQGQLYFPPGSPPRASLGLRTISALARVPQPNNGGGGGGGGGSRSCCYDCGVDYEPPDSGCMSHFLHRIESDKPLSFAQAAGLFGFECDKPEDCDRWGIGVHGFDRREWNVRPAFSRDGILDDVRLAPGLYYTSSGEDVVSSLEVQCRVGMAASQRLVWERLYRYTTMDGDEDSRFL